MKATAKSPANIAFIKYWGKKDSGLNLPMNDSISMNLSDCVTASTVEFNPDFEKDKVTINRKRISGKSLDRVINILDLVRKNSKTRAKALVVSENNFPTSAGIASSASAFSALALAASKAAGLNLSDRELSILARRGSGSACRSVGDGFIYWHKGQSDGTSYARPIAGPDHWDIRDIVAVVSGESKKTSSTQGHEAAFSSPYYRVRQKLLPKRIAAMKKAIMEKDFESFGEILETEAVDLHVIAMTSRPPIFYWNEGTILIMRKLVEWRQQGLKAFFTMDAGANVHVLCEAKNEKEMERRLKNLPVVKFTIVNRPAIGARII